MKKGSRRNFLLGTKYSDLLLWVNEQISGEHIKKDQEKGAFILKNKISIIIEIFDKD